MKSRNGGTVTTGRISIPWWAFQGSKILCRAGRLPRQRLPGAGEASLLRDRRLPAKWIAFGFGQRTFQRILTSSKPNWSALLPHSLLVSTTTSSMSGEPQTSAATSPFSNAATSVAQANYSRWSASRRRVCVSLAASVSSTTEKSSSTFSGRMARRLVRLCVREHLPIALSWLHPCSEARECRPELVPQC